MHYRWLKDDPDYRREYEIAHELAISALEAEATRRGHEGVEEPLVFKGRFQYESYNKKTGKGIGPPLAIRKWSDQLLMFRLRAERPDKYRERHQVEHTGSVDLVDRLLAGRKRAAKKDGGSDT